MNFTNFNAQKSLSLLNQRQDEIAKDKIDQERQITTVSNELSNAQLISNLLRYSVILASLLVLVGGVGYMISHGSETANFQIFRGESRELCSPVGIIKAVYSGDLLGLIQFGLLILIATPLVRVALSVFTFIWQRDLIYALLTLFVLMSLIYSFLGAYV